ncbi:MAG: hypothetical protein AAB516_01680 [Patescibacteria group bacterium]
MNKFKTILLGSVIGFALGVFLSTFLYYDILRIFRFFLAFDSYILKTLIMTFSTILGGTIGWITLVFKKESVSVQSSSNIFWIFLILILTVSISFYAFSFTTTYECNLETKGDARLKDMCYSKHLLCEKVVNSETADSCYYNLAEYNVDPQICNKILDNDEASKCLGLVAVRKSQSTAGALNSNYCDQLGEQENRDWCYAHLDTWKNPNICEKIIGQTAKNECYSSAASQLCDENLCGKIIDEFNLSLKDNCLGAVKLSKTQEYRPGGNCNYFQEEQKKLLNK